MLDESAREQSLRKRFAVPEISNWKLFWWMFRFARLVRGTVVLACVWLTVWCAVEVFANRQAGETVNHIKNTHATVDASRGFVRWIMGTDPDASRLRSLIAGLTALVFSWAILRYFKEVSAMKMSMRMVYYIREAIYDKLQRVGFGFHDALTSGQIINRALSDLQNVRQFLQSAILISLEIALVVVFYIILIWTRNPWVACLALAPIPVWTWYILRFSKRLQPAAKSVLETEDRNVSIITENIAGVHVVKAFATEKQEIEKYSSNCDEFKQRVLKRIRLYADFNPIIRSIAQASYLTLFAAAGYFIIHGRMQAGDFLILAGAMGAILGRLQGVATINEHFQNAMVSARRLYEVLMAAPTVAESARARALPAGPGRVVFENVTFGYDPTKPVLHDVSFSAEGGSIVAIVGPTGAGKTTLVNLISRFYDPQRGRILLDGHDLKDLALASLRTQVAFVFQETYLFSDTVSANIAYGRPGITHGEIEAAARLAQAHEFIDTLPKRYDTVLRERGSSLSGGQKQRLAIARAIVTNPRVLILDDATAAIDPETEDMIRRAMSHVMHGRTTFVIAHRISTVKRADLVVVIENGRVTQTGTHNQLMEEDGHYRDIAFAQLRTDDEEVEDEPSIADSPSHMKRISSETVVGLAAELEKEGREQTGEAFGE